MTAKQWKVDIHLKWKEKNVLLSSSVWIAFDYKRNLIKRCQTHSILIIIIITARIRAHKNLIIHLCWLILRREYAHIGVDEENRRFRNAAGLGTCRNKATSESNKNFYAVQITWTIGTRLPSNRHNKQKNIFSAVFYLEAMCTFFCNPPWGWIVRSIVLAIRT